MVLRLRGGGGDGGVYPLTHAEMQWMTPSGMGTSGGGCHSNATKDKVTGGTMRFERATVCACSSKPLRAPIAVCDLGYILNKEDVIEYLLGKKLPEHLSHIRSLKGLHDATLHPNPAFVPDSLGHTQGADDEASPFSCPVGMLPMNGRYSFVYIKPTKQVVSQRALKQVGGSMCPITEQPLGPEDTIPINPPDDERKELAERLTQKRALAAEAKRKAKGESAGSAINAPATAAETVARAGGGTGSSAAGGSAAAEAAAAGSAKAKAKAAVPKPMAAPPSSKGLGGGGGAGKRPQREWEKVIETKASSSEVYKSLFISAEERKRLEKSEAANFCARGIVPSLSRSTKFGLG